MERFTSHKKLLEALFQASAEGIIIIDEEGKIILANPRALQMFGYSEEELVGQPLETLLPAQSQHLHQTLREGFFQEPSNRPMGIGRKLYGRTSSGKVFPVEVSLSHTEVDGNQYAIGLTIDITKQKETEEALYKSQIQYQTLFNSIDQGFCLLEMIFEEEKAVDYRFLEVNTAFEEQTGLKNVVGKTARQFVPDLEEHWFKTYGEVAMSGRPQRFINESAAMRRWFSVYAFRSGEAESHKVALLFSDISEQKRNVEALKESELRYRSVVEQATVGIVQLDLKGYFIFVNDRFCEMVGRSREELLSSMHFQDITEPEDLPYHMQLFNQLVEQGKGFNLQKRYVRPDGSRIWIENDVRPVYNEKGQPMYVQAISQDITEHKKAVNELKKEKETAQRYLDTATSIFVVLNKEGEVILINRKGCEVLGYKEDEIIGKFWFDFFIPQHERDKVLHIFHQIMAGLPNSIELYENPVVTKQGKERIIEWHNAIIDDEQGQPSAILSSGVDVTERRKAERSVMNALIEGQETERERIAKELHDGLGQQYTAMLLNLNVLEKQYKQVNAEAKQSLEKLKFILHNTIQETKTISRNLMPGVLKEHGLVKALQYLCHSINDSHQVNVTLQVYNIEKSIGTTYDVSLYRITQEVINNAIRHGKATEITVQMIKHEESVMLMAEDNGSGFMKPDINTRSEGLGLKSMKARVKALQGSFHIDSHPGQGTTVSVEIPL